MNFLVLVGRIASALIGAATGVDVSGLVRGFLTLTKCHTTAIGTSDNTGTETSARIVSDLPTIEPSVETLPSWPMRGQRIWLRCSRIGRNRAC
jgi:hypothetical protein